jgi:hypothetical protein
MHALNLHFSLCTPNWHLIKGSQRSHLRIQKSLQPGSDLETHNMPPKKAANSESANESSGDMQFNGKKPTDGDMRFLTAVMSSLKSKIEVDWDDVAKLTSRKSHPLLLSHSHPALPGRSIKSLFSHSCIHEQRLTLTFRRT